MKKISSLPLFFFILLSVMLVSCDLVNSTPEIPAELQARAISSSRIDLSWEDTSDSEDGFILERSLHSDFFEPESIELGRNTTSYTDKELTAATRYFYRIKAYNNEGDSEYSNTAEATTYEENSEKPFAPSDLSATTLSPERINTALSAASTSNASYNIIVNSYRETMSANSYDIDDNGDTGIIVRDEGDEGGIIVRSDETIQEYITLSWKDNADNETGFIIERDTSNRFSNPVIIEVTADTTSYDDFSLEAATTYYYRVYAVNNFGTSGYSNVASATTSEENQTIPVAPTKLEAVANSYSSVTLQWGDNSDNETGFIIERSLSDGFTASVTVDVTANTSSYNDTGLQPETVYYYRVKAYNLSGDSDYSSIVDVTTPQKPQTGNTFADHTIVNMVRLDQIPVTAIENARAGLHIAYGHTSHGSQIISGMNGLDAFKGGTGLYAWNEGGSDGALDIDDYFVSGDLGNPDRTTWATRTREYLDKDENSDVNVVIWSWCGQASTSIENIDIYLSLMEGLIQDYPGVSFVFMTGHLNGGGVEGTLHLANEHIRQHCREHNRWLLDFADIESYDPDGKVNYNVLMANDNCDYDNDGDGTRESNWALDWQNSHTENEEWYNCSSAHSQPLNANMKAYAAWWLWCRISDWDGAAL